MKNWSREEIVIAFNLYCKIPFKDSRKTHPLIVKYAEILGRSPSALNMKIGNIGRLDPDLKSKGIVGLAHGSKLERSVWEEFYGNPEKLAYESEILKAKLSGMSVENIIDIQEEDLPKGTEKESLIRQRVNQSFFRSAVMSAYNSRCCISGVSNPDLLEACHIIGWKEDVANRTNPKNGLCLNPFFHKAYDKHLLSVSPDLTVDISDRLIQGTADSLFQEYLKGVNGKKIIQPSRFLPQKEFLEAHFLIYKSMA